MSKKKQQYRNNQWKELMSDWELERYNEHMKNKNASPDPNKRYLNTNLKPY